MIEGVVYQHRRIDNKDERRTLETAFNGGDFVARQVKVYHVHKDSQLGGHFHKYAKLFYVINGEVDISLIDPKTEVREEHALRDTDSLLIPAFIAHRFFVKTGAIFVGCSEEPYISPELNDHRYNF